MRVTILHILTFIACLFFITGVWQFAWIVIHRKGYEMEKVDEESFPDFLFRYYADDWRWKLRKKFVPRWFYYSKCFLIFTKIKGVVLIFSGLAIAFLLFYISGTEYGAFLQIEL